LEVRTVLLAELEPNLRAVVVFSGAGYSFDRSPELRARLLSAIDHIAAPVFFIHAENDYSLSSGKVLDARREQIGKPRRLKIYPPIGHTVDDGHDFLHLGANIWEAGVFAFLDENMRRRTCRGRFAAASTHPVSFRVKLLRGGRLDAMNRCYAP
jgi:carboxymethylenebutenolidase